MKCRVSPSDEKIQPSEANDKVFGVMKEKWKFPFLDSSSAIRAALIPISMAYQQRR
jgi:hypothetical protein